MPGPAAQSTAEPTDAAPATAGGGDAAKDCTGDACMSSGGSTEPTAESRPVHPVTPAVSRESLAPPTGPQAVDSPCNGGRQRHTPVTYRQYEGEHDLQHVMRLIDTELSEPYSIFTYRYFLHQWPSLCFFACGPDGMPVATIVAKAETHKNSGVMRGYIAMLVVEKPFRGAGTGTELVRRAIEEMKVKGCEEVVLEAETTNGGALAMYEALGFIRDKRLERYYLSGTDAFRLKLLLPLTPETAAWAEHRQLRELSLDDFAAQQSAIS